MGNQFITIGVTFIAITGALGTLAASAQSSRQGYPKNLFAVTALHFDAVREPHGLDWYLKSREASMIIQSISAGIGVHPSYVSLAVQAIPSATPVGEETNYVVPVEPGYAYCGTRIRVTSIVPASGDRASTINAAVNPRELQMSTWTPVRHFGEGRSWAEGDIQVYGIKPAYLNEFVDKGVCARVTQQVGILSCRGVATCGAGVMHGDPQDAGSSTPVLSQTAGW